MINAPLLQSITPQGVVQCVSTHNIPFSLQAVAKSYLGSKCGSAKKAKAKTRAYVKADNEEITECFEIESEDGPAEADADGTVTTDIKKKKIVRPFHKHGHHPCIHHLIYCATVLHDSYCKVTEHNHGYAGVMCMCLALTIKASVLHKAAGDPSTKGSL